ncbi:hypothetical protein EV200_101657 [Pedobacter psychrotolerans]|uniref:Uncharacterized protein n=1 Tax=Pedobacter psychrotolerans TaxID=1843235 RepID=A0A4R2HLY9_9SPHI|nr:hypothetical protein [Pedobacter psychrotolerans]TCO31209.1 hypothetical protein EV200_101657 [Pedobacter psychrotolerans]GGE41384.1 hypothetical protein GCM10011413_04090 [Pedobacter psychrotolerans]
MLIETTLTINVPSWAFWKALITKEFVDDRGGYFQCDWAPNSPINWITDKCDDQFCGKVLQVQKLSYLSYIKYQSAVHHQVHALVSYQIWCSNTQISVKVREDLMQNASRAEIAQHVKWLNQHLRKLAVISTKIKHNA